MRDECCEHVEPKRSTHVFFMQVCESESGSSGRVGGRIVREIRRADRRSVANIVDRDFEEWSTPFEYLPKCVDDTVGLGDRTSF